MLRQRVVTALLLAAAFLLLLTRPAPQLAAGLSLVVAVAAWEWAGLASLVRLARAGFAVLVLVLCGLLWRAFDGESGLTAGWVSGWLGLAAAGWAIILLWVMSFPASSRLWAGRPVLLALGVFLLLSVMLALLYLAYHPVGAWLILYLVALVACADIGAYFAGRSFGRHKLAPAVSPAKTWEGVVGGMLAVALFALVARLVFGLPGGTPVQALVLSVVCGGASVLGDLLESMVKRHAGVKDSSQLLPGHGGLLDRVDGIIAAAPVFAMGLAAIG